MAVTDPIADMFTMIRNAYTAKKDVVEVKNSKMHEGIMKILKQEGFISNYKLIKDNKQGLLRVYLRYDEEKTPAISGIRRISKPSLRIYKKKEKLPSVYSGLGIAIISTSKGLLTDKEARENGVGGEVICHMW